MSVDHSNNLRPTTNGPTHVYMPQRLICQNNLTGCTSASFSMAFTAHLIICCSQTGPG